MKRKIMALVMTAIVATGVLAGCGGNSDSTSTSGSSEGSTSESSASASAASGEAAADELSGTITAAGSSALKPLADDAAEYFNELHPDVSITIDAGGSGTLRFSTSTAAARRTRMPHAQGVFRPPLATTNFH